MSNAADLLSLDPVQIAYLAAKSLCDAVSEAARSETDVAMVRAYGRDWEATTTDGDIGAMATIEGAIYEQHGVLLAQQELRRAEQALVAWGFARARKLATAATVGEIDFLAGKAETSATARAKAAAMFARWIA